MLSTKEFPLHCYACRSQIEPGLCWNIQTVERHGQWEIVKSIKFAHVHCTDAAPEMEAKRMKDALEKWKALTH
jgi:hypothetical protein